MAALKKPDPGTARSRSSASAAARRQLCICGSPPRSRRVAPLLHGEDAPTPPLQPFGPAALKAMDGLLTDPVQGLQNYGALFDRLQNPNGAIKIHCEVAG